MHTNDETTPSSAAARARLYRQRKSEGLHVARVEVGPEDIEALVREGLLEPGKSSDRAAISEAIEWLLLALSEYGADVDPEWIEYQNDDEEAVST